MALTYDAPSASSNWDNEYVIETKAPQFPLATFDQYSSFTLEKISVRKTQKIGTFTLGSSITYTVPGYESSGNANFENVTMYLFEVSEPEDIGGGVSRYTKKYGSVPSNFTTTNIEAVTFPGYYSEFNADNPVAPATSVYRPPLTKVVEITETHSYVENIDPISGSSGSTLTPTQVLTIQNAQKEYVDYVDDNTLDRAGSAYTYTTYQALISGSSSITYKPPVLQQAYGAGTVWELIEYTAKAQ
jgi:hypothetical protein